MVKHNIGEHAGQQRPPRCSVTKETKMYQNRAKLKWLYQSQYHEDNTSHKLNAKGNYRDWNTQRYSQGRSRYMSLKYNFIHEAVMQKMRKMNIQQTHMQWETERGIGVHNPHIISARENIKWYLKEWDGSQAHYNHNCVRGEQYSNILQ